MHRRIRGWPRRSFTAAALLLLSGVAVMFALHPHRAQAHDAVPGGTVPIGSVSPGATSVPLRYDGMSRSYLLVRPPNASGALPLVVLLHGTGIDAREELVRTGFGPLAESHGFEVAVPQSIGRTWNSGNGCCSYEAARHIDDSGFVRAVLADVRERTSVDPDRIYLVGYSNGGKLSYGVACTKTPVFAGLATYGAGPQTACPDAVPISLFIGYGQADRLEPPAGEPANARGRHQPLDETVAQFLHRDHCAATSTTRSLKPARITTHAACAHHTAVQVVEWRRQTHAFPRAPGVPAEASAATLMWQFLRDRST